MSILSIYTENYKFLTFSKASLNLWYFARGPKDTGGHLGSVSPGRGPYITIHYTHWRNNRPSTKNNLTFLKLMLFLWRARPRNIFWPYPHIPPPSVKNIFIKSSASASYSIVSSEKQDKYRERDLQGHYKFCKPILWRKVLRAQLALFLIVIEMNKK